MNLLQYLRMKILSSVPRRPDNADEKLLFLNVNTKPTLLDSMGHTDSVIIATDDLGAVDNALVRTDGIGGSNIQNSTISLDDSGNLNAVNAIRFTLSPAGGHQEGQIHWNPNDKTIDIDTNEPNVVLQVGQEMYIRAINDTGADLVNGQYVYVSGALNELPKVKLATASDVSTSRNGIGVVSHTIHNQNIGFIRSFGTMRNMNTSAWLAGDSLYISNTAGQLTNTPPVPPKSIVRVGLVLYSHATNGIIFIHPAIW